MASESTVLWIRDGESNLTSKLIQLYAVVQLNYRQPAGDAAWAAMRDLVGEETTDAIAFLTGMCYGGAKADRWREMIASEAPA